MRRRDDSKESDRVKPYVAPSGEFPTAHSFCAPSVSGGRLNLVILYQIIMENAWKCAKEDDIIIIDFCVPGGDDYG